MNILMGIFNKFNLLFILFLFSQMSRGEPFYAKGSGSKSSNSSPRPYVGIQLSDGPTESLNGSDEPIGIKRKDKRYKYNSSRSYSPQRNLRKKFSNNSKANDSVEKHEGYYDYLLRKNNRKSTSSVENSLISSANPPAQNIRLYMMFFGTTDIQTPNEGKQKTPKIEYIINPRYLFSENYSVGLRLEGEYALQDESKTTVGKGFFLFSRERFDLNKTFSFAPSILLYLPVNNTQTQDQSYKFGLGTRLALGNADTASFKDYFTILTQLIINKGYYEYKTIFNQDPQATDKYNTNYTFQEKIFPEIHIYSKFWFCFYNVFTQKLDYANTTHYYYSVDSLLKYIINDNFELYGGINNEDELYDANKEAHYRIYDSQPEKTRWQFGFTGSF